MARKVIGISSLSQHPGTLLPKQITSYSSLGALSNFACFPERGMALDGQGTILRSEWRPNPVEKQFSIIDGRAVTSCAAFEFDPSVPRSISITYRSVSAAIASCSDGCVGSFCGTGGDLEVFVSPDFARNAYWSWQDLKRLAVGFPRANSMVTIERSLDPSQAPTVRSVLVCRTGAADERDDIEIDFVTLNSSSTFPVMTAPSAPSPYREKLTELGNAAQRNVSKEPGQIWNTYYPTPSIYSLLSAWMIDHNPEWRASIERQVQYSNTQRLLDGLPFIQTLYDTKGNPYYEYLTRDQMAREAIAQYHVYEAFSDIKYLRAVDSIALNMKNRLVRGATTYKNRTYRLFYGRYSKAPGHAPILPEGEHISPNQNAEVGLLFTLLFHNPKSRFYRDPLAKEIAIEELDAAISVQKASGALPLTVDPTYDDTGYGSYTLVLLAMANSHWRKSEYTNSLIAGGQWLKIWLTPGMYADHYGNNLFCRGRDSNGRPCEHSMEMWSRLPSYYLSGLNLDNYVPLLYKNWLDNVATTYDASIVFMKSAGLPIETFLPRPPNVTLYSFPSIVPLGGKTEISWSAPGMVSCRLTSSMPPRFSDVLWDTALSGFHVPAGGITSPMTIKMSCLDRHGLSWVVGGTTHVAP